LKFMPDSKSLISFGDDSALRLWEMRNGKARFEHFLRPDDKALDMNRDFVRGVAITADGSTLVLEREANIYLFDIATGKQLGKIASEGTYGSSLVVSPDGKFLLSSGDFDYQSGKHSLTLFDVAARTSVQQSLLPGISRGAVAFSSNGRLFAATIRRGTNVLLYEKAGGMIRGVIRSYRGTVEAVAFLPDNRRLASSLSDGTIVIWDLAHIGPPEKEI